LKLIKCNSLGCKSETVTEIKYCPDCMRKAGISESTVNSVTALLGVVKLLNAKTIKDPAEILGLMHTVRNLTEGKAEAGLTEETLSSIIKTIEGGANG